MTTPADAAIRFGQSHPIGKSMMTGLDWIAFNVERAIGLRDAGPEEADIAQRVLPRLLEDLPKKADLAVQIRDALNT